MVKNAVADAGASPGSPVYFWNIYNLSYEKGQHLVE
jgi:hypothetical protein